MLKLRIRADLKCHKHPRFDPAKEGLAAVKGGCTLCIRLCEIYVQAERLVVLRRLFTAGGANESSR